MITLLCAYCLCLLSLICCFDFLFFSGHSQAARKGPKDLYHKSQMTGDTVSTDGIDIESISMPAKVCRYPFWMIIMVTILVFIEMVNVHTVELLLV